MSAGDNVLNDLAQLQLTLGEFGVRFEVMTEAMAEATAGLAQVAEQAVARGEVELARQALDIAQSVTDKVRTLTHST